MAWMVRLPVMTCHWSIIQLRPESGCYKAQSVSGQPHRAHQV